MNGKVPGLPQGSLCNFGFYFCL